MDNGVARRIQDEYLLGTTVEPLGGVSRYLGDLMSPDDWDAKFVVTYLGRMKLRSRSFSTTKLRQAASIRLDPTDQALWSAWALALSYLNQGFTLRQVSDKLGSFRTMRSVNYLLAEQYIARKD